MRRGIKPINFLIRLAFLVAIVVFCAFATSCSGKVSGEVFYDSNGNGFRDFDEQSAQYIKVMVTVDGEKKAEGFTTEEGTFSTPIKKGSKKEREICILVSADVNLSDYVATGENAAPSADVDTPIKDVMISSAKLNTFNAKALSTGEEENPDDLDGDGLHDETGEPIEAAADDDGDKEEDDPADDEEEEPTVDSPPTSEPTIDKNKVCVTSTESSVDFDLALNEQVALGSLSPMSTIELMAGEITEIPVSMHAGGKSACILEEPLQIPDWLSWSAPPQEAAPPATPEIEEDPAAMKIKGSTISTSVSIEADELKTQTLYVYVDPEKLGDKEKTFNLQFTEKCAGQTHNLPPIPLKAIPYEEPKFEVIWGFVGGNPPQDKKGEIEFSLNIKEEGRSLKNAIIFINAGAGAEITASATLCKNHGMSLQCNADEIMFGNPFTVQVAYETFLDDLIQFDYEVSADNLKEPYRMLDKNPNQVIVHIPEIVDSGGSNPAPTE